MTTSLKIMTTSTRDLRLDLFRGLANWAIFLDHIPDNVIAWVTTRNYGFSDAADLFVFVSGYTVALVYGRILEVRGVVAAAIALLGRVWQIYVAYILLFVIYTVSVGYVAQNFGHSHLLDEFNVRFLIQDPIEILKHGLLLQFKPLNLDVLPLYVVLMAAFAPTLWFMVRWPSAVLGASFALYLAARSLGWNLAGYPTGTWYFNPFAWQFLFVIGAWFALGGTVRLARLLKSRAVAVLAATILAVSAAIVLIPFDMAEDSSVRAVLDHFLPNDKTNLGPYRIVHFLSLALVVTWLVPKDWKGLQSNWAWPAILCGQRSLEVFCAGIFLSFVAHFLIELVSTSVAFQAVVSFGGIAVMTFIAWYRTWVKGLANSRRVTVSAGN
jgi:hypothetical protein